MQLKNADEPMAVDVELHTDGQWQVAPLLDLLPAQYVSFRKDMKELDGKVELAATAKGTVTDSTMPLIDAQVKLADGRFYMPKSLPYNINRINGDLAANLNLGKGGISKVKINSLKAHTRNTDVSVKGKVDDLLGDMRVDATVKAALPLEDAMPMVPDSLKLDADGKADIDIAAVFRMSDINAKAYEKIKADADIKIKSLDLTFDTIHATSPDLGIKLRMPATEHSGKMADVYVKSGELKVKYGQHINATLEKADIGAGVNNPMKEQIAAAFNIKVGETEANMDSMMVSLEALAFKGSVRLDSTQKNVIRQYNPDVDLDLHGAVLYMPDLPDAVGLGKSTVKPDACFCKVCDVECGFDLGSSLFGKTRDQDAFLPVIDHRLHDPDNLRRCFSRTIDHLGSALQDTSVRIHFRISEVIKRRGLQLQESFLRSDIAALK